MPAQRNSERPSTVGARRRDPLIRQVIRARRSVEAARQTTPTGDPAKVPLVERAKQWVHGDPPQGTAPGTS